MRPGPWCSQASPVGDRWGPHEPEQGGPYGQIRKWAFIHWEGHHGRGSARHMPQSEHSGCCERSGYRKPRSVAGQPLCDYCPFPGGSESRSLTQTTRLEPGDPHTPSSPISFRFLNIPNSGSCSKTVNGCCAWVKITQTTCDIKNPRSIYFEHRECQIVAALFKELLGWCEQMLI